MSRTFKNPVVWEDLPDPEVLRVGDTYYMSASSFHFSPGAPILRSTNLVDWEYIGHSVPELPPRKRFQLDGKRPTAYGKGVWASTLKYRESNGLFYFYSAIQGTDATYIWTAKDPAGDWTAHAPIDRFYYDLGLLVDDDDIMYIAYGTKTIEVAQLSSDGLSEVRSEVVWRSENYFEGARMYKRNGTYYIWITMSGTTQSTLKSTTGPFGPYELRDTVVEMLSPLAGSAPPHQGGLVDTPDGQWYYMAFSDSYPAGRIPVLAPIEFDSDGWPKMIAGSPDEKRQWLVEYPRISPDDIANRQALYPRRYDFKNAKLAPCWEWNHNPDNSKWRIQDDQMVLETGTITNNLLLATNTLTLRMVGPGSISTFCLDISKMRDGDRAGLSTFRDECAYIGVHKDAEKTNLVFFDGVKAGPERIPVGFVNGRPVALDWHIVSNGAVQAETPLQSDRLWLRIKADVRGAHSGKLDSADTPRHATFSYSYDGNEFIQLGPTYTLTGSTNGYIGYRFGLFNFATKALGGEVQIDYCDVDTWEPSD